MEIERLIVDLAIMLSVAAAVAIVFKKLKLPTILGYIVAGFLIGPNFKYFLEVESQASIEVLSEIGVIIILFHIGLEFDFHKIADIGSTALVSALVKMSGVLVIGYFFGMLLGMKTMDCVFLGAMLSISSTVVIQKCFTELGMENEKCAGLVMGSLVMEDIISVFMMVILTTISVGQGNGGSGTLIRLGLMICYLAIWLVLGIYIVPTLLDKAMNYMNDEMLTILSLGFCFLMALLANALGFSSELGAFLAGSFFAGTKHIGDVERVTKGVKDLFGTVFFLSVGMMVDPQVIADRWTSIIPIAIIAVIAKLIFATIGMVLSGQDLDTAIRGGISLAPIGEFSFIIAGMGIALGVMDQYLYPVIVASSILTIIITPVLMKRSDEITAFTMQLIPAGLRRKLDSYTSEDQDEEEKDGEWSTVIKDFLIRVSLYGSIMFVAALAGCQLLRPRLEKIIGNDWSGVVVCFIVYAIIAVFLRPYMSTTRNMAFTKLWTERLSNRPPLLVMILIKIALLILIAYYPIRSMYHLHHETVLIFIIAAIIIVSKTDFVVSYYLQLEARFLSNLNQKTMDENGGLEKQHWLDEDYSIFSWTVPEGAAYAGKTIEKLGWGQQSVYVVKLRRGSKNVAMPPARTQILTGDKVYVIGDKKSLRSFYKTLNIGELNNLRTLREFLDGAYPDKEHALACLALKVRGTENYSGKPIKQSGINMKAHCMILGLERNGYATTMPDANMIIEEGDILWIIGTSDNLNRLALHSVGEAGKHKTKA